MEVYCKYELYSVADGCRMTLSATCVIEENKAGGLTIIRRGMSKVHA